MSIMREFIFDKSIMRVPINNMSIMRAFIFDKSIMRVAYQ